MSKKDEALKLALEALDANRQTHYYCEDTWYSCPKHEYGCANDSVGDECNCGADIANVEIDKAIIAIREALASEANHAPEVREQPAQGCDYCNHPQYAGTKCKNCGREQPAPQQEPVAWVKDCADFWEHYTYISEASQENYKAEAQMWVEKLRTSPQPAQQQEPAPGYCKHCKQYTIEEPLPAQPSKPWVGLTDEDILRTKGQFKGTLDVQFDKFAYAIEAKLREKNT